MKTRTLSTVARPLTRCLALAIPMFAPMLLHGQGQPPGNTTAPPPAQTAPTAQTPTANAAENKGESAPKTLTREELSEARKALGDKIIKSRQLVDTAKSAAEIAKKEAAAMRDEASQLVNTATIAANQAGEAANQSATNAQAAQRWAANATESVNSLSTQIVNLDAHISSLKNPSQATPDNTTLTRGESIGIAAAAGSSIAAILSFICLFSFAKLKPAVIETQEAVKPLLEETTRMQSDILKRLEKLEGLAQLETTVTSGVARIEQQLGKDRQASRGRSDFAAIRGELQVIDQHIAELRKHQSDANGQAQTHLKEMKVENQRLSVEVAQLQTAADPNELARLRNAAQEAQAAHSKAMEKLKSAKRQLTEQQSFASDLKSEHEKQESRIEELESAYGEQRRVAQQLESSRAEAQHAVDAAKQALQDSSERADQLDRQLRTMRISEIASKLPDESLRGLLAKSDQGDRNAVALIHAAKMCDFIDDEKQRVQAVANLGHWIYCTCPAEAAVWQTAVNETFSVNRIRVRTATTGEPKDPQWMSYLPSQDRVVAKVRGWCVEQDTRVVVPAPVE